MLNRAVCGICINKSSQDCWKIEESDGSGGETMWNEIVPNVTPGFEPISLVLVRVLARDACCVQREGLTVPDSLSLLPSARDGVLRISRPVSAKGRYYP